MIQGSFENIPWDLYKYFLNIEVDDGNSGGFTDLGTQIINSIPYAMHANTTSDTTFKNIKITEEDIYIEQIGKGIIIKSPNGSCWRVTVDDTGNLISTEIVCP